MKELYEKLYNIANESYKYKKETVHLSDLSHFVAMKGREFDQDDVRLFVIGRAVNGWKTLPCESAQVFADAADKEFNAPGFRWVADDGDSTTVLHNIPAEGESVYYLSKSPFWRTVKKYGVS